MMRFNHDCLSCSKNTNDDWLICERFELNRGRVSEASASLFHPYRSLSGSGTWLKSTGGKSGCRSWQKSHDCVMKWLPSGRASLLILSLSLALKRQLGGRRVLHFAQGWPWTMHAAGVSRSQRHGDPPPGVPPQSAYPQWWEWRVEYSHI